MYPVSRLSLGEATGIFTPNFSQDNKDSTGRTNDFGTLWLGMSLRANNHLQGVLGLEALTEDSAAPGNLGDGIDVDDVVAMSHDIPEGNRYLQVARLEFEALVSDGRGAVVCNRDGNDDDGEIEGFF